MASKEGEDNCEAEEETIALQKKRSRRVSFAETTAIHLFVREEDYETPPDKTPDLNPLVRSESDEIMELLQSSSGSSSGDDDSDNEEEVAFKGSFIRPIGSPSPASTTFGSATSNDEDNFFGPVSTDFIKPRRLSNSAASDENHDITMDSTAFSMHFRSLARSDSGGECKTPTGIHLAFEERTPGQISTATSTGDMMVLTGARKPISSPSLRADKVTDSGQSDDMSLVCVNQHRYDYGKLPAELDVLLAEGGKDIDAVSTSLLGKNTSALDQSRDEILLSKNTQDADVCMKKVSPVVKSAAEINAYEGKDSDAASLGDKTNGSSSNVDIDFFMRTHEEDKSKAPTLHNGLDKDLELKKDTNEVAGKFASPPSNARINLNNEQRTKPSVIGSVSSLLAKHRQIFKVSADLSNEQPNWIPLVNEPCHNESIQHASSMSNYMKSDSRLKRLEAFPFASASKAESNAFRLTTPQHFVGGYRSKESSVDHVDAPVACLDEHFSNVAEKDEELNRIGNLDATGLRCREEREVSRSIEEVANNVELQSSPQTLPLQDKSAKVSCAKVPPSSAVSANKRMLDESASPPAKEVKRKVLASSNCEKTLSTNVNQHDFAQEAQLQHEESFLKNQYHYLPTSMYSQTPLTDEASESCALVKSAKALHVESIGSAASLDNEFLTQTLKSPLEKQPHSLLSEIRPDMIDGTNGHRFADKTVSSPRSILRTSKYEKHEELLEKTRHGFSSNNSSGSKRKYWVLSKEVEGKNAEISLRHQRSTLLKYQNQSAEGGKVSHDTGDNATLRHWPDDFTTFCREIEQLLAPWSGKLDLALSGILIDVLTHLEKKKSYELQHQLCFQKDYACFLQDKRLMKVKLLLYRNVYEKVKLHLLQLKRNKLSDLVQRLNSRVQESETLVSSCRLPSQKDIQVYCFQSESCHTDIEKRSLGLDDLSLLREELDVSDRKMKNLIESFHSYFKVMKNQTCSQTTEFAKDFLKSRISCRSLQSEMQLCEVESLKTVNGQQNFLFDHLGFISQRFIVNSKSTYGVSVSSKLNSLKICKMFLSMDAKTAFSFIFSGDTILTFAGVKTVARETQKTNLLLHNLLDVVEEAMLAMGELKNLTESKFFKPSVEKLDLRLCFCDFKSGTRVTLNVDVSCLKWGVYPSQVVPYELQGRTAGKNDSFQLLLTNIRETIGSLRGGHTRVLNLCRCVSQVMKASILNG